MINDNRTRIVYSPKYNLGVWGLQYLHPFDGYKFHKAWQRLRRSVPDLDQRLVEPRTVSDEQLGLVHTDQYLDELRLRRCLSQILEIRLPIPVWVLNQIVVRPMQWATGGTILAAREAVKSGICVNLGGGYHHASIDRGEGFCIYADIPIAIEDLRTTTDAARFMVLDLDAHQGNGIERVFAQDENVGVFDLYNGDVYPQDRTARMATRWDHCVKSGINDEQYLKILREHVPAALDDFRPDVLFYVAGTDIFAGDPLGRMSVSAEGIFQRDCFVFEEVSSRSIPLVVTLGGGYTAQSHELVSCSVEYLLTAEFNKS